MKVLLIQPALELDRIRGHKLLQRMFRPAPVTLPTVAACTPARHDVRIVDDAFMQIPYDADVDVVGITSSTPFAVRMREIADRFRARGVRVVVGGAYPTLCPDGAKELADAVSRAPLNVRTFMLDPVLIARVFLGASAVVFFAVSAIPSSPLPFAGHAGSAGGCPRATPP